MALSPLPQSAGSRDSSAATARVALLLKQWGGEVIAEFKKAFKLRPLHRVKTMPPGQKATLFPAHAGTSTKYHRAGDNLLTDAGFMQTIAQGDRTIWADREVVTALVLDEIEERLSYWPDRAAYAKEMAYTLAEKADQNVIFCLARAARGAESAAGNSYTGAVTDTGEYLSAADVGGTAGVAFTANNFVDLLALSRKKFAEKNVPEDQGRYCLIKPSMVYTLLNSSAFSATSGFWLNRDFGNDKAGSMQAGQVGMIHGFTLIESNNFPTFAKTTTDNKIGADSAGGEGNDYRVDMQHGTLAAAGGTGTNGSRTQAFCFTPVSVGSVVSSDISIESERKMELRGDLIIGGYAMGHGILRPECVIELAENGPKAGGWY